MIATWCSRSGAKDRHVAIYVSCISSSSSSSSSSSLNENDSAERDGGEGFALCNVLNRKCGSYTLLFFFYSSLKYLLDEKEKRKRRRVKRNSMREMHRAIELSRIEMKKKRDP